MQETILNKVNLVTNSLISINGDGNFLQEGRGKKFTSKFIVAGVAEYMKYGKILITKETLDKFIQTIIGCPVIIQHKDITEANANKERVGVVSDVWFNDTDGWYYCSGIIWDEKALDLIINKGWSVSCTYDFESDNTKKTYNGQEITQEFTNGKFLHLAIVPDPRYERANIVFNAKDKEQAENYNENHDEEGRFCSDTSSTGKKQHPEFGQAYAEFSYKPKEAINHLLSVKQGYVPNAVTKEGIGDIDFVYGKTGKAGYGLAHIIEQRDKQGTDGIEFVKTLPDILENGEVIEKENHTDRKYILSNNREAAIRLDYNGEKRNWIVTAYIKKELSIDNSLEDWYTMLALDSNLNVMDGCVSTTTPVDNIITNNTGDFNPGMKNDKEDMKTMQDTIENGNLIHVNFKEQDHPRDERGRFAEKGNNISQRNKTSLIKEYTAVKEDIQQEILKKAKIAKDILKLAKENPDEAKFHIKHVEEIHKEIEDLEEQYKYTLDELQKILKTKVQNNKADNNKEQDMTLLDELKKLVNRVENRGGNDMEKVENAKTDKRKLIDEIGGILKGKVDDELIRTIIKKAEEIAYDESEAGTADNKKAKNETEEKEEKFEEEKEIAANKCAKNEDKEEKEDDEKKDKAENSMNDVRETVNSGFSSEQSVYMTLEQRLKLGKKY